jgi:2'-5' RNA ligase
VRCFVAVDLSPDVRVAVARAQATLRALLPRADVRWVEPAAFHLTLKFLGQVDDARLPAISAAVAAAVAGVETLPLAAGGVGGFPSLTRPRVLWAGVTAGVPVLRALAGALDRALEPLGFPPEARPFRGHLTIGRVRSPRGLATLAQAVASAEAHDLGTWAAREVVLYESRLRPSGAVYVPLARHPLGGGRT